MPVVTISRQPGSLAPEIARLVAQRLHMEIVDQETIHELASQCDTRYQNACALYEREVFTNFFERLMLDRPVYRALFEALHFDLAARGGVIILGRGAQFAFKGFHTVTISRIISNQETRVRRIMEQENISHTEAEDFDDHYIARHRAVIRSIFEHDLLDAELYDVIINTSYIAAEKAADILCQVIEHKRNDPGAEQEKAAFKRLATARRIETLIRHEVTVPPYRIFSVEYEEGGKVALNGFVENLEDIAKCTRMVEEYPGVTSVDNRLRAIKVPYFSI